MIRKDNSNEIALYQLSISEIILFLIILAIAIRNFVQFIDWSKKRAKQAIDENEKPLQLENITKQHERQLEKIRIQLKELKESVNLLIESDRYDIKHSITGNHHYFCYEVGSIDDYSLDCLERKYIHYKDEGGNSFVASMMEDLRNLPRNTYPTK